MGKGRFSCFLFNTRLGRVTLAKQSRSGLKAEGHMGCSVYYYYFTVVNLHRHPKMCCFEPELILMVLQRKEKRLEIVLRYLIYS